MHSITVAAAIGTCMLIAACAGKGFVMPEYRSEGTLLRPQPTPSQGSAKTYSVQRISANTPAQAAVACRLAGFISPAGGRSFTDYFADALTTELIKAGMYDRQSEDVIGVRAVRAEVETSKLSLNPREPAVWHVEANYSVRGRSSVATADHAFRLSHANGQIACTDAAYAFPAATKEVVQQVVQSLED